MDRVATTNHQDGEVKKSPRTPETVFRSGSLQDQENIEPSDSEDAAGSDTNSPQIPSSDEAEDVIGVSLGEAQTHLKSAKTPATEKTQALEESGDHFGDGMDNSEAEREKSEQRLPGLPHSNPESHAEAKSNQNQNQGLPSPWRSETAGQFQRRADTSRSFLKDSLATSRKRASSGSAIFTEGLRRLFPDFLTISKLTTAPYKAVTSPVKGTMPGQSSEERSSNRVTALGYDGKVSDTKNGAFHVSNGSEPLSRHIQLQATKPGLRRPQSLRRVTSDSSLFLKRQISTSTTESGHQWDHVQEQVNSRMKAIRDTWQDASFKMPKLPNINLGQFVGPAPQRSETHPDQRMNGMVKDRSMRGGHIDHRSEQSSQQGRIDNHRATATDTVKTHRHPILADALSRLEGDVVVLGGYRGSILRSAKPPQRQLWVPIKVGLNIRRVDLEVGLTAEDEERMEEDIIPSGSLSHIGPVDICRRLLRKLRDCHNAQSGRLEVHDYGYDWRLSPHLLSRRLVIFLEELKANQLGGGHEWKGATIIAHSLGGLITRHAVNLRPELFAGVIYAGVPQHCVNILGPLRHGDAVLLSSRVLTAQVNFTLRTSFLLLPETGRCFFNKETGERYDVDFFDPQTWEEYRLSPCVGAPLDRPPERSKSLIETFSAAISNSIASLPNPARKSSWLFSTEPTPDKAFRPGTRAAEIAHVARDEIIKGVDNANNTHETLEPSMKAPAQSSTMNDIATACTIPRPAAMEYLTRTLHEVRNFKEELRFKEDLQRSNYYPPAAVLYGRTLPTVYGAKVASREAIKQLDAYDRLAFGTGDGVVLSRAAMLPEGYKVVKDGLVSSDRGHVGLLGDLEGVGACLTAVLEGRRKGIGLGQDYRG